MSVQSKQPIPQDSPPSAANQVPKDVIPSCSVCGRQDETLRIASLPFVVSIIVVTFRRAMAGMWCQRHRNLRLALAGSITAIFGWVGIPYGFIYTPLALFSLARGGNIPTEPNVEMLKTLAEHKLKRGDIEGAVRCLEEVLRLSDDEASRKRLSELYGKYTLTLTPQERPKVLPLLIVLLGAPVIGALVGVLDFLIVGLFNFDPDQEVSIFLVILSWIPLVFGIYIAGLILNNLLEWALSRSRVRSLLLGMSLSIGSAGLAAYGVPSGRIMAEFLGSVLAGASFGSFLETIQVMGAILTKGGAWMIVNAIQMWEVAGIIYVLILLAALIYFSVSGFATARSLALQRERVDRARPVTSVAVARTEAPAWLTLVSVLAAAGLLVVLFINIPKSRISPAARYVELAEQMYQQGDFAGAATELEQAISFEPDNGILHSNLGWAYLQQGRFLEAKQELLVAIDLDEMSADTYLALGISQYVLQEYEAARSNLLQVLDANPPDETRAEANFGLAMISNMNGDLELAILYLEGAVRLDPMDTMYKTNLGWVRYHNGDYTLALQTFQDVLSQTPFDVDAKLGLAFAQFQLEDFENAEASFEELLDLSVDDPRLSEVYIGLSMIYEAQNNLADAAEYIEMSLTLASVPDVRIRLIYDLVGMGDFEAALNQCDLLIAEQPGWAASPAIKAWVYFAMGQTQAGEVQLESALSLEGEDLDSIATLGLAYRTARMFPEAEEVLLKAVELAPENDWLTYSLVDVLNSQAKYDEAMDVLEDWIVEDDEAVLPLVSLGSAWIYQGDLARGHEEYSRALQLDPDEDLAHSGLSFIYFHQGLIDESQAEALEAIRLNPYSSRGYKNLAFAYHAQGNIELAMEAAQEALRLYPAYDEANYILGLCYMEIGEDELAIEAFERFLAFYYERPFVRDFKVQAQAYLDDLQ